MHNGRGDLCLQAGLNRPPVVFKSGTDPVKLGIVESVNRPGGNLTGVSSSQRIVGKAPGVLRELAPSATVIGFLTNPKPIVRTRMSSSSAGLFVRYAADFFWTFWRGSAA